MDNLEYTAETTVHSSNKMEQLLAELSHYRQQSERLQKVNTLHQRLAGILDLSTMIETYSIWLAEHVSHELIGYNNHTRQRKHMFCSSHGHKRRLVIDIADQILQIASNPPFQTDKTDNIFPYQWDFENNDHAARLILLRKGRPFDNDDIILINESMFVLADPLRRAIAYEEVFEQARKDILTGLPNRFVFEERIDSIIEQARRHKHPVTLAALDLDHFKEVNDTMGHLMGDEVLKKVAATLQKEMRITDLLVRMGGDEFLLILPDTDIKAACSLNERLCLAIDELNIQAGNMKLGISIGLVQWQPDMSKKQWLEQADDILYQAKRNGRAQVAVN